MEVRKQGAHLTPTTAEGFVGGSWRSLKYGEGYIGGQWRTIASFVQPLTLSVTTDIGSGGSAASSTVTSKRATATPTGGLGPFTYAWTRLSQTGGTFSVNSPTSSSTTFTATGIADGATASASYRCTVTDSLGSTASDTGTITCTNTTGISGGP